LPQEMMGAIAALERAIAQDEAALEQRRRLSSICSDNVRRLGKRSSGAFSCADHFNQRRRQRP
jgi:hypothetical protein